MEKDKCMVIIERIAAVVTAIWMAIIVCTKWWEFILTIPFAVGGYLAIMQYFTSIPWKIFGIIACTIGMLNFGIYVAAFWLWVVGAIFSTIGWCISSGMGFIGTCLVLLLIWWVIKIFAK